MAIKLFRLAQLSNRIHWLVRTLTQEVEPKLWLHGSARKGVGSFYLLGRLRSLYDVSDAGQIVIRKHQHCDLVKCDTDLGELVVTNVRQRDTVEFQVPKSMMEIVISASTPCYELIEHAKFPCLPLRGLLMANDSAGGPLVFLQHAAHSLQHSLVGRVHHHSATQTLNLVRSNQGLLSTFPVDFFRSLVLF